jgi:aminoglycoside phosphotransferase (APT) family kinase protein
VRWVPSPAAAWCCGACEALLSSPGTTVDDRLRVDANLVSSLVAQQFPRWAGLPVRAVEPGGWDHRTFRLGDDLGVRMPSARRYADQVEKEYRWLPRLAPLLPLPIPRPLVLGRPSAAFPFAWTVFSWIEGETADTAPIADQPAFATALAHFLVALYAADARGGPASGPHNFFRGGALATYDAETRATIRLLGAEVDSALVTEVWETALRSTWPREPVWVHGDVAAGNLLVRDGRLAAVIDFGSSAVGDPACDLSIAWTFLGEEGRTAFRGVLPLNRETWQRGRGWTLWKALIVFAEHRHATPQGRHARRVIETVLADHRHSA